jgi:alpha-mannosidase
LLLTPHKGDWQTINSPRIAEEFIAPPAVIYQGIHKGTASKSASFLSIDAPNVIIAAAKLSEDQDDGIMRLVETFGKDTSFTLHFPSVPYEWRGKIKAFEIKTLRLSPQSGDIREVNLLEE